jgi:hypothetical protein
LAIQTKHGDFFGVVGYFTALHLVKGGDIHTSIANLSEVVSFIGKAQMYNVLALLALLRTIERKTQRELQWLR